MRPSLVPGLTPSSWLPAPRLPWRAASLLGATLTLANTNALARLSRQLEAQQRQRRFRPRALRALAVGATAIGATGLGALAIGAVSIGALTVASLALARLRGGDWRIARLRIHSLEVERWTALGNLPSIPGLPTPA